MLTPMRSLLVLSLVLSMSIAYVVRSSTGDLAQGYTDHLRQVYMVGVAAQTGPRIYRETLGQLRKDVHTRYVSDAWLNVPFTYPPGILVPFIPLHLLAEHTTWPEPVIGKMCVLVFLLLTHLGLWMLARYLDFTDPVRRTAFVGLWLFGLLCALNGFYELAWLTPAIAGLMVHQERPKQALIWIALAGLMSYRGATLTPVALYCLWRCIKEEKWGVLRNSGLWIALLAAVISVSCLVAVARYRPALHSAPAVLPVLRQTIQFTGSAVLVFLLLRKRFVLAAALVGWVSVLGALDHPEWWHASMALIPLWYWLFQPRQDRRLAWGLLAWCGVVQLVVWNGYPLAPLWESVRRFL